MPDRLRRFAALCAVGVAAVLGACSGSSGNPGASSACTSNCDVAGNFLTEAEVRRVIAQAVAEAQARNVKATIAVVDRMGNPLAIYEMTGAPATIAISSGLGVHGGLDGVPAGIIPAALSAIAKAITGASSPRAATRSRRAPRARSCRTISTRSNRSRSRGRFSACNSPSSRART